MEFRYDQLSINAMIKFVWAIRNDGPGATSLKMTDVKKKFIQFLNLFEDDDDILFELLIVNGKARVDKGIQLNA